MNWIGQSAAKRLRNKVKVQRLGKVNQNGRNSQECVTPCEIQNKGYNIGNNRVPNMRKFNVSKNQLIKDYKEFGSMQKIAGKYGVSKRLIMNRMDEFNISRKSPSAMNTAKKVKNLSEKGLTTTQIANTMGVSDVTVRNSAKLLDFELNNYYHKGYIVTHNGYKMVSSPFHPNADSKGYIREHRLVMEKSIGRFLSLDEIVHHINHDKMDNRIDNLEITDLATHTRNHHLGKKGRGKDLKPRKNAK